MFGFPEAQHRVYKTNFLRNVIYKFRFQEIQNFSNKESEFREILDSHFPQFELKNADSVSFSFNNKNIGDIEAVKGEQKQYIFKSKNEKIILDFQNTSISVNILGNEYISFENLQPSIEILKNDTFSVLPLVPAGGTDGQVLTKVGLDDYNFQWKTPSGLTKTGILQLHQYTPLSSLIGFL